MNIKKNPSPAAKLAFTEQNFPVKSWFELDGKLYLIFEWKEGGSAIVINFDADGVEYLTFVGNATSPYIPVSEKNISIAYSV